MIPAIKEVLEFQMLRRFPHQKPAKSCINYTHYPCFAAHPQDAVHNENEEGVKESLDAIRYHQLRSNIWEEAEYPLTEPAEEDEEGEDHHVPHGPQEDDSHLLTGTQEGVLVVQVHSVREKVKPGCGKVTG